MYIYKILLSETNANCEGNAKELSSMRERDLAKLDYVYYHASQRHQLCNRVGGPREGE